MLVTQLVIFLQIVINFQRSAIPHARMEVVISQISVFVIRGGKEVFATSVSKWRGRVSKSYELTLTTWPLIHLQQDVLPHVKMVERVLAQIHALVLTNGEATHVTSVRIDDLISQ